MTGGRIKRIAPLIAGSSFCLTYGDGVAEIDVRKTIEHHQRHGRKATVTAVPSPGRFGILSVDDAGQVQSFREKPDREMGLINGAQAGWRWSLNTIPKIR